MSELTSILLHLDASPHGTRRVAAACRLAQAHGARLEALYAVLPLVSQLPLLGFDGDAQAVSLLLDAEAEQRRRVRASFDAELARAGQAGVSWLEAGEDPVRALTSQAWAADLLVLGQHDPEPKSYPGVPADFAATVMLASGKPGLVMPYIDSGPTLGETVLIAWKPSPEAARAVSAALPLLQRARRVHLATWNEGLADGNGTTLPIERFLGRHGIAATLHANPPTSAPVGELLLSLAADLQADLMVMGCYGHGRAREWVLGGATRTVLGAMTLPVLMAH